MADGFVTLVSQSFSLGIRAAPGRDGANAGHPDSRLVGRTLPQLNILSLGFGLNAIMF